MMLKKDCKKYNLSMTPDTLALNVFDTKTGQKMSTSNDVYHSLTDLILKDSVSWPKTISNFAKKDLEEQGNRVLAFGPGHGSGSMASLTAQLVEGAGVNVIAAETCSVGQPVAAGRSSSSFVLTLSQIFASTLPPCVRSWSSEHGPRIDANGQVETAYTRLTGRPPILVAGMTPTTSFNGGKLVAVCANAGYQVELAAGGLPRKNIFRDHVVELSNQLQPGAGFAINLLYLNAKQWGFQFPMIPQLVAEGLPIESITVAAGVPTRERGSEILAALRDCGIRYVSFKPGSKTSILDVIRIAEDNPDMGIVVQWTGGRGGGHHSFEDMHEPILQTYGHLRSGETQVVVFLFLFLFLFLHDCLTYYFLFFIF